MLLPPLTEFAIGNTKLFHARAVRPSGNLFLKLESGNPTGSVKDRTAYYLVRDAIARSGTDDFNIVESTSGNLGLGLQHIGRRLGLKVHCVVDPSMPTLKRRQMEAAGLVLHMVSEDGYPDGRTARVEKAREMERSGTFVWTNQYANYAGLVAHFETTGPEIWDQTKGQVDTFVCSVGSGGTICGVGRALKDRNPRVNIVAVEPEGSTIFGGTPSSFITAGAGFRGPSELVRQYGSVVDFCCHVKDSTAIARCRQVLNDEGVSIGITAGGAVDVGLHLAGLRPDAVVVVLAPDDGQNYQELIKSETCVCENDLPKITPTTEPFAPEYKTIEPVGKVNWKG